MFRIIALFPLLLGVFYSSYAQQKVYSQQLFYDAFDNDSVNNWNLSSDPENNYTITNSNFQLHRSNKQNADLVFCKWINPLSDFEIKLDIKFEANKLSKEQYAGVALKANNSEAILAEIHQQGKIRIRVIKDKKASYLSGDEKNDGWVKIRNLSTQNNYNTFSVHCDSNRYTISINDKIVFAINENGFKTGRIGIIVGANSKINVGQLGVFGETKPEAQVQNNTTDAPDIVQNKGTETTTTDSNTNATIPVPEPSNEVKPVNTNKPKAEKPKSLAQYKAEMAALEKEYEAVKVNLNQYRNMAFRQKARADSLDAILKMEGKAEYRNENRRLSNTNTKLQRENDSLVYELKIYQDIRLSLTKNESTDISALLAIKLREMKAANDSLESFNKELVLQNKKLTLQVKNLESQQKKSKKTTKSEANSANQ